MERSETRGTSFAALARIKSGAPTLPQGFRLWYLLPWLGEPSHRDDPEGKETIWATRHALQTRPRKENEPTNRPVKMARNSFSTRPWILFLCLSSARKPQRNGRTNAGWSMEDVEVEVTIVYKWELTGVMRGWGAEKIINEAVIPLGSLRKLLTWFCYGYCVRGWFSSGMCQSRSDGSRNDTIMTNVLRLIKIVIYIISLTKLALFTKSEMKCKLTYHR